MGDIFQILKEINVAQLIAIGIMLWFFYSRLLSKLERSETKLDAKIDKLDTKVNDIDKRLFAIETLLHMKDCCFETRSEYKKS